MIASNVSMYESDREYESDNSDMDVELSEEQGECEFCQMPVEDEEGWLYTDLPSNTAVNGSVDTVCLTIISSQSCRSVECLIII